MMQIGDGGISVPTRASLPNKWKTVSVYPAVNRSIRKKKDKKKTAIKHKDAHKCNKLTYRIAEDLPHLYCRS